MTNKEKISAAGKPHILFLGSEGFPIGFGGTQRALLIARGMVESGCRATVISFKGVHGRQYHFPPEGIFQGVHYLYTSGTIHRPSNFLRRNWMKVVGKWNELRYIRQLHRKGELSGCLLSAMHIEMLLIYRFWFSLHGIPVILNFDELNSAIASRTSLKDRINDFFFDRWVAKLTDGMCPISDYLIQYVKDNGPSQPILKLPILCDFEHYKITEIDHSTIRFLYCGAASYRELIAFVIESFERLKLSDKNVNLEFILGGKRHEIETVEKMIAGSRYANRIKLDVNVPHAEIPSRYSKASALLIPMRPTVQDAARFPHKLGEYLASAKPVITTAYGEINNYAFNDEVSALVAKTYDTKQYSKKMQYVIDNPDGAKQIGLRGREMGMEHFDYREIGKQVKDFILSFPYAKQRTNETSHIN